MALPLFKIPRWNDRPGDSPANDAIAILCGREWEWQSKGASTRVARARASRASLDRTAEGGCPHMNFPHDFRRRARHQSEDWPAPGGNNQLLPRHAYLLAATIGAFTGSGMVVTRAAAPFVVAV